MNATFSPNIGGHQPSLRAKAEIVIQREWDEVR